MALDKRFRLTGNGEGTRVSTLSAEESVWNFLDLKITQGNPKQIIEGVSNLVITESPRRVFLRIVILWVGE